MVYSTRPTILGFLPFDIRGKYTIQNGDDGPEVLVKRSLFASKEERYPVSQETAIRPIQKGFQALTGRGSVELNTNGNSIVCENIFPIEQFINAIQEAKMKPQRERAEAERCLAEEKAAEEADRIPDGIVLSTKVFALPAIQGSLDDILYRCGTGFKSLLGNRYWVNRGDPICRLSVDREEVVIVSPVSGLMLQDATKMSSSDPWFEVLLPEDEPQPLPISDSFRSFCEYMSKNRKNVAKVTRSWSAYSHLKLNEDDISEYIGDQLSREYIERDLSEPSINFHYPSGFDRYDDWLIGRAKERTDIAKALTNVLDLIEERSGKTAKQSAKNENTQEAEQPKADDEHREKFKAAREEALKQYELTIPFRRVELDKRRGELLLNALPSEVEKIHTNYEVLLPLATD